MDKTTVLEDMIRLMEHGVQIMETVIPTQPKENESQIEMDLLRTKLANQNRIIEMQSNSILRQAKTTEILEARLQHVIEAVETFGNDLEHFRNCEDRFVSKILHPPGYCSFAKSHPIHGKRKVPPTPVTSEEEQDSWGGEIHFTPQEDGTFKIHY